MKKALILGISPVQTEAIETLQDMGIEVHTIARDSIGPGKDVADVFQEIDFSDLDLVMDYMTEQNIDIIYSVGSDIAMPIATSVSEALYLPHFVSSNTAIICNKKDKMRRLTKGIEGHIPFQVVKELDFTLEMDYPVFIKPTDSQGQRGITLVESEETLHEAVTHAINNSKNQKAIIEKYIGGYEVSVNGYVVDGDIKFLIVSDRETWESHEGLIHKHILDFNHDVKKEKIRRVISAHLEALDLNNGPFYAQMKIEDEKAYMIEITPRLDGCHMHKVINHATGVDLLKATFSHLIHSERPTFKYEKRDNIVLEFQCHVPNETIDYSQFEENSVALEYYKYYQDGDTVKPVNGVFEKVGYHIYRK